MALNIGGLIVIVVFYVIIFAIGIWTAWSRRSKPSNTDEVILAGHSLGPFIGFLTLTATWVGGGYINGSAEAMYSRGFVWCQAPIAFSISLVLGGLFFAKQMRSSGHVTILDPLQDKFGKRWGSFLFLPALAGETIWSAITLATLGITLTVMLNLDSTISIIVSAAIAVSYTLYGGLAAVAYTDAAQLFCIFFGLWVTIPFAINHEAVGSMSFNATDWVGSIDAGSYEWGEWIDIYLLIILGGIPWQAYFQRVLSARDSRQAQVLSLSASLGCIVMMIPACIIGIIAKATDWEATAFNRTISPEEQSLVLPLVIQYLTPTWVSYMGLGAVSAAVMSSADSVILSSSSMFARNIYKNVFRLKASEKEQMIVMRITVVVIACLSCVIAIHVQSVYYLFQLCSDLVYVILFPQFLLTIHAPNYINIYGSISAYFIGLIFRILGGEKDMGLPALVKFPWYDEENEKQMFPFRTLAMILSLVSLLLFSWLSRKLRTNGISFKKSNLSLVEMKTAPDTDDQSPMIQSAKIFPNTIANHCTDGNTSKLLQ